MSLYADEGSGKSLNSQVRSDILTGGVMAAAILLFVGTGGSVIANSVRVLAGYGGTTDRALAVALILNIALILFGWVHYRRLRREIVDRTREAEQARKLADTDPLTGLLNRRAMLIHGQQMLAENCFDERHVAMMLIDLDHFKSVNDSHGHVRGDQILHETAIRLQETLPDDALKARLGGDEFIAMLKIPPGAHAAVDTLAAELLNGLREKILDGGHPLPIGGSLGIALAQDSSATMEQLVRQADIAMYHCKENGRNRHIWFETGMEMAEQARSRWESAIVSGMANGEFSPHFEPQVELETGRIIGFEMLMRWDSASLGQVPPERFIPLAEQAGLISNLSLQVVRDAMMVARHWHGDIMLSINLSPLQLRDPWFSQKLIKLLIETGFPAQQLEVEVTETALIDDKPLVTSIINSLKNQGVRLTLDSFGTGYASLSHLRSMNFDRIKIDRSFIAAMTKSADARAIVMAVLRLGESLATSIVAKGVEDEATAKELIALGCKQAQGWYFGRAASTQDLMAMLSARGLLRNDGEIMQPPLPSTPPTDSDLLRRAI